MSEHKKKFYQVPFNDALVGFLYILAYALCILNFYQYCIAKSWTHWHRSMSDGYFVPLCLVHLDWYLL